MNKEGGDDLGPMASPSAEPVGSGWLLRRDSYGFHRTFVTAQVVAYPG